MEEELFEEDIEGSGGEETRRLMEEYDIDEDQAETVQELIDEGFDEEDAVDFEDFM